MSFDDDEAEVEYEVESFIIHSHEFHLTTISYMPIERLVDLQAQSKEISGQKLWCGSLCLMEYLTDFPHTVSGKNVLELGAGTGVVGMLCDKLGSRSAVLTDNDERSIRHMREDCPRNNVRCKVHALDWFDPDGAMAELGISSFENLCVLAGDVLYKHVLVDPFFQLVTRLLSAVPESEMLLCHIPRAGVDHEIVLRAGQLNNLTLIPVDSSLWRKGVVVDYSPSEDYDRAQIYRIKVSTKDESSPYL